MCKKYRPSNGTEGEYFIEKFCYNCIHEKFSHTQKTGDLQCDILDRTMMFDTKDEEYPSEWTYDEKDKPTCTKFIKWDWGKGDDDGNGFNEPPVIEPVDPNQLSLFPIYPDERNYSEKQKEVEPVKITA